MIETNVWIRGFFQVADYSPLVLFKDVSCPVDHAIDRLVAVTVLQSRRKTNVTEAMCIYIFSSSNIHNEN